MQPGRQRPNFSTSVGKAYGRDIQDISMPHSIQRIAVDNTRFVRQSIRRLSKPLFFAMSCISGGICLSPELAGYAHSLSLVPVS